MTREVSEPPAVQAAHDALAQVEDLHAWAGRFALLSDPTRLRLLFCLHHTGGMRVSDLAAAVDMSDSSVSHSLRLMRERGWVTAQREGRSVVYALVDEIVHDLLHRIGADHAPGSIGLPPRTP